MVQFGLLYKYFWQNLRTRKFSNQIIQVVKEDFLKIKRIDFKYHTCRVDLNGSLTYLSKLKELSNLGLVILIYIKNIFN